jgi:transcriptional regulator with XRE-family HTH domain
MPLPVLPSLFHELAKERDAAGISQEEMAERCGVSLRTVERWEALSALPVRANSNDPGGDLARVVDRYSELPGATRSPFELWADALQRSKQERKRYEDWLSAGAADRHPSRAPSRRTKRAVDAIRRQRGK